jgi:DNA modification methylase
VEVVSWNILEGDVREVLRRLPDNSVHSVVTSPPYWGLRDYGVEGQLGLEPTPEEYVQNMVEVFREVRRVLRDDGTLWLNLGDSYASGGMSNPSSKSTLGGGKDLGAADYSITRKVPNGLKPKDLVGIPWRVAFALQADGWYLRSDIIWEKPNAMPESVRDRPTKSHEYIFLLSKSKKYFYDNEAIKEPAVTADKKAVKKQNTESKQDGVGKRQYTGFNARYKHTPTRNKRTVWSVATKPYEGAHFAVFPPDLIRPCILAGVPEKCCDKCGAPYERVIKRTGHKNKREPAHATDELRPTCDCNAGVTSGVVLDPFMGSGTTLLVATEHGRQAIGIELNPKYIKLAHQRLDGVQPRLEVAATKEVN